MGYMILIKDLQKYYNKKNETIQALKDVNLEFGRTGFVVLTGKSGSGKSTLLNILGGLDDFSQGDITFMDQLTSNFKSSDWDTYRNSFVGFVFQEFYLIENLTIGQNIAMSLELQGCNKTKIKDKVVDILKMVDLAGYENRFTNELSGGQKQRIAVCRALIKDPQIILADEPTGNLDSDSGQGILEILKKLSKTKLVIMVTHDLEFAKIYGDRIIELKDGKVISDTANLKDKQENTELIRLQKGKPLATETIQLINKLLIKSKKKNFLIIKQDKAGSKIGNESFIQKPENITKAKTLDLHIKNTRLPNSFAFKLAINNFLLKKFRLILLSFLFISTLIFVGITTNLSFYNVAKASNLTFEKADVKEIPLLKADCDNCYNESFNEQEIHYLKTNYQSIKFLTSIVSRNISIADLVQLDEVLYEKNYYTIHFNKVILIDETKSLFKLKFGDFPKENEVVITDFMAEMFIVNQAIKDVSEIQDLVGKEITHSNIPIKISGIVETDYQRFAYLKENTDFNEIYKTGFFNIRENNYSQVFMTKETFDKSFYLSKSPLSLFEIEETQERYMQLTSGILHPNDNDVLNGRLPEKDSEIVLSLKTLIELMKEPIDITKISSNVLSEYLNKTFTFGYNLYEDGQIKRYYKDYTVVGILNDLDRDVSLDIMFTRSEFQEMNPYSPNLAMTAYLGTNDNENTIFINDLDKLGYFHDTDYSRDLYWLQRVIKEMRLALNIMALVFGVFSAILMYTFISNSIYQKQKEIGTLRSLGARGIDVSKIFIFEGIFIALYSSIISSVASIFLINILNNYLTKNFSLNIVLFYPNPLSILVIFLLSIIIFSLSTYLPIRRIIKMKPINAIKNLR